MCVPEFFVCVCIAPHVPFTDPRGDKVTLITVLFAGLPVLLVQGVLVFLSSSCADCRDGLCLSEADCPRAVLSRVPISHLEWLTCTQAI